MYRSMFKAQKLEAQKQKKFKLVYYIEQSIIEITESKNEKKKEEEVLQLASKIDRYLKSSNHKDFINQENHFGSTPLILACDSTKVDLTPVVKILLQHNANIHCQNKYEKNALCCAAINGHEEQVKELVYHAGGKIDFNYNPNGTHAGKKIKQAINLVEKAKNSFKLKIITSVFEKETFDDNVLDIINEYATDTSKLKPLTN